jgi:hypothetical protein
VNTSRTGLLLGACTHAAARTFNPGGFVFTSIRRYFPSCVVFVE